MFEQIQEKPIARTLDSRWWIGALRALFALLLALAAFLRSGGTLGTLLLLLGAYAVAEGATSLVVGTLTGWRAMLFVGATGIAAGSVTFIRPAITPLALTTIVAAWMLLRGGLDILTEILLQREIRNEWLLATSGVVSILFAGAALLLPSISVWRAALLVGTLGLVEGAIFLALTVRLYRAEHRVTSPAGT